MLLYDGTSQKCYIPLILSRFFNDSLCLKSICFLFSFRPMVPQLAPPKIPEGDRVDFDVSDVILTMQPLHNSEGLTQRIQKMFQT